MKSALIVIDVQMVYTTPGSALFCEENAAVIGNINRLVDAARSGGEPIYYVRHIHHPDGSDAGRMFDFSGEPAELGFAAGTAEVEFDPRLKVVSEGIHLEKQRYSCFAGTGLHEMLQASGVDTITVVGFMTNFCCETTARHGHDLDYFVDMPIDATGCPHLSDHYTQERIKESTAAVLSAGFARVMKTDELLAR